jgi:uncharacterized protein
MPPEPYAAGRSRSPAVQDACVALGRALRASGALITVDDELCFARALGEVDIRRREQVYWAARSCFVRDPAEIPHFDAMFERFWQARELTPSVRGTEHGESDPRMTGGQHGGETLPQIRVDGRESTLVGGRLSRASRELPMASVSDGAAGDRRGVLAAYSPSDVDPPREPLRYRPDELAALRRLAEDLRDAVPQRRSRRARIGRRGRLDVRRTLRRSLRTEGEALRLAYVEPSLRARRVLILCDVSGSMDRYSRVMLASLRAAVGSNAKAEAFVFATRLTRLTRVLARDDAERALERARAGVRDWSGGTRIGEVLAAFNRGWARRGLARGAIAIVISDGWDRGDPAALATELNRLRLQCRRLVWVNPRPLEAQRQPLAIGLRAALPFVDDYVPGNDLRAMAGLGRVLRGVGSVRPDRRQRVSGRAVDSMRHSHSEREG